MNPWQRLRYVTLPNISPVLMFAAITGVIAALQYFTEAVVAASVASGQATTGGGNAALLGYPRARLTYAQWLYVMGFKNYPAAASALAVVMFVVSLWRHAGSAAPRRCAGARLGGHPMTVLTALPATTPPRSAARSTARGHAREPPSSPRLGGRPRRWASRSRWCSSRRSSSSCCRRS